MLKVSNVNEAAKGDIILVKETTPMWNSKEDKFDTMCFEYAFEIVRNNPKTLGCKYINGPYKGSGFNWIKGYDVTSGKKEYFKAESSSEIVDKFYEV